MRYLYYEFYPKLAMCRRNATREPTAEPLSGVGLCPLRACSCSTHKTRHGKQLEASSYHISAVTVHAGKAIRR